MPFRLELAGPDDVNDLVFLRAEMNRSLEAQFGQGFWISGLTDIGVLFAMRHSSVFVARRQGKLVATLTLATKKPWAIDRSRFTPVKKPLYLTSMAVSPDLQRQGIGSRCVGEAVRMAKEWPADAIFLDAWNHAAGAAEFYRKCGFREVGPAVYRAVPLIYFELLLQPELR
jgi:ribosomal protein S18 acetylase RimI-like enzyme